MEPDFRALQVIAEVSLGLVGFSAIIIALSRSREGFSDPDNFRVQLLNFAAFGAMFNALIPFAIFGSNSLEISWTIVGSVLCFYSAVGLLTFPRKVFYLRRQGYAEIFPLPLIVTQMGVFVANFMLSAAIVLDLVDSKNNVYLLCLILFIVQSTVAFIRTMFVRVE